MKFETIGDITQIEIIAIGNSIRVIQQLRNQYGSGRWRKLKGIATVRFHNGQIAEAEVHWYEAHGIGKRRMKVKRVLK